MELAAADVWATGISPDKVTQPSSWRSISTRWGAIQADRLLEVPGSRVLIAGAVTHRQRPATAQGDVLNIEDETGMVNDLITPGCGHGTEDWPRQLVCAVIRGRVQNATGAVNGDRRKDGQPDTSGGVEVARLSLGPRAIGERNALAKTWSAAGFSRHPRLSRTGDRQLRKVSNVLMIVRTTSVTS